VTPLGGVPPSVSGLETMIVAATDEVPLPASVTTRLPAQVPATGVAPETTPVEELIASHANRVTLKGETESLPKSDPM
jgi:hypothetical protein